MMRWALERCREKGCGMVQLTSNKKRLDAHRFYVRLGFQQSHEGFKYYL
jgi:GNAT superfamily N-acetyltransferase